MNIKLLTTTSVHGPAYFSRGKNSARRIFRKKDKNELNKENDLIVDRNNRRFKNGTFEKLHKHRQSNKSPVLNPISSLRSNINDVANLTKTYVKENASNRFTPESLAKAAIFHPTYFNSYPPSSEEERFTSNQKDMQFPMIPARVRYLDIGPFPGQFPGSLVPAPPMADFGVVRPEGVEGRYYYNYLDNFPPFCPPGVIYGQPGFPSMYSALSSESKRAFMPPLRKFPLRYLQPEFHVVESMNPIRIDSSTSLNPYVENDFTVMNHQEEENESDSTSFTSASSNTFVIRVDWIYCMERNGCRVVPF